MTDSLPTKLLIYMDYHQFLLHDTSVHRLYLSFAYIGLQTDLLNI